MSLFYRALRREITGRADHGGIAWNRELPAPVFQNEIFRFRRAAARTRSGSCVFDAEDVKGSWSDRRLPRVFSCLRVRCCRPRSTQYLLYLLTYLFSHSRGTPLSHLHCPAHKKDLAGPPC